MMRTTLTLEPDVARKLKERVAQEGATMKRVVNDALRVGLETKPERKKKYRVRTFSSGLKPGIDPNRLNQLLDELEVEDYLRKRARDEADANTGR